MAATVDYCSAERIRDGDCLPPLWHWIYFLEGLPPGQLGNDGHPARGGFLPPVPLPNRMWAGGRLSFPSPLRIGSVARKESSILNVTHKTGRAGDLVFVTVLHEFKSAQGEPLVREEHDIVYKAASPPGKPSAVPPPARPAQFTRIWAPTTTTLFRYSALTFNGHRIHYDTDYCRTVEGYAGLVIHGPLIATMLANYAEEVSGCRLAAFDYRALAPALLGETITLHATVQDHRVTLHATQASGAPCLHAEAVLA
jgi:3-methylfumaryl-CoA hydratase